MAKTVDILIIDDDTSLAEMLCLHFEDMNLTTATAEGAKSAQDKLKEVTPRLILLDQHMPDTTGLDLLPKLKEQLPDVPVLMITGKHDMELAIQAIKMGALDYIHKPIDTEELNQIVTKALRPQTKDHKLTKPDTQQKDTPNIIGTSKGILEVVKSIAIASSGDATVLISGETGTGKDLVARAIHHHSHREGQFLAINCSAIVESLLESELFGHEKGAFTGASERKEGKFFACNNGTLFLDEIGEMSLGLQAKLLRVLQEQSFERVGGTETLHTNAHIVAATHRDLEQMVKDGKFREDLYYRLKIITVNIPSLRERMEDLKPLIPFLLGRISKSAQKDIQGVTDDALYKLESHNWPGNVRELENVLMRAAATTRTGVIMPEHISFTSELEEDKNVSTGSLKSLEELEREHVAHILRTVQGHKGKACDILGISRPALDRKIKKYGL